MNPNYALKVKEDLDKLLDIGFIYPIRTTKWLSSLIIVRKKNKKLWICVDYHKLNAQTKKIHSLYPRGRSLNQIVSFFFFLFIINNQFDLYLDCCTFEQCIWNCTFCKHEKSAVLKVSKLTLTKYWLGMVFTCVRFVNTGVGYYANLIRRTQV